MLLASSGVRFQCQRSGRLLLNEAIQALVIVGPVGAVIAGAVWSQLQAICTTCLLGVIKLLWRGISTQLFALRGYCASYTRCQFYSLAGRIEAMRFIPGLVVLAAVGS